MDNNGFEMHRLPSAGVGPIPQPRSERKTTRDELDLVHFGKRQQFKRNFSTISMIGLTCTLMITWEGDFISFEGGFYNGGPKGLVWGFVLAWLGVISQVLVMAEMGSMIPLAGGQYNWVAVLAPPSCSNFLSYLTGWITVIAWQVGTASSVYLCGSMIQGLVILNYPDYVPERWQATLMFYAIITLSLSINTYFARVLPQIEAIVLIVHVLGFFGILIPLVYLAPKGSVSDVFGTFINSGGWKVDGLAFFVGSIQAMFSLTGIDAATHLAEEIENAAVIIPRSMIASVLLNGSLGFAMLIAILFCLGNVNDALKTPTGYPYMEILVQAARSTRGGTVMICFIVALMVFSSIGTLATSSRMLWAFAREKGLPGSAYISRVDPRTSLPVWSIVVSVVINLLLALINIGSNVVFNALTGLTVAGIYSSFMVAASVMLWKRLTTPASEIRWGPFKLGRLGVPITLISIAYSIVGWFFSFWPPTATVTVKTMNWSVTVYVGVLAASMIYWLIHARHVYTGPIIEVNSL
ncbi:amino acid/polyamine transporter I [Usnea florida]